MKNEEEKIKNSSICKRTGTKRAKVNEEDSMTAEASLAKYINDNFIKSEQFYKPKNQSLNEYRHFGIKTKDGLLLSFEEVFYIFYCSQKTLDIGNLDLKSKIYFDLKNSGFNVLFHTATSKVNNISSENASIFLEQKLYRKTKHFNKKSANPLKTIEYASKYDKIENLQEKEGLLAITGDRDYCLIDVKKIESLSFEINDWLKKNNPRM